MFSIALKRSKTISSISKVYTSRLQTTNKSLVDNLASIEKDKPINIENPYVKKKRQCLLCKLDIEPDYKNVRLLSQFQSRFTGRIYGRHITGLCEHKQKRVEEEILKAQSAGLMSYWTKEPEYVKDPPLFDPNYPFRPHKY